MNRIRQALKDFYEQVGEKYPEEDQVYRTLRGKLRRAFVLSHLARFHGSLLDVGCNRGGYLREYHGGARFGVDLSSSVLRHLPKGEKILALAADAERLQCFKAAGFDNVLCSEVLEHCLNPQAVFQSIFHVLRPNGSALLTTPNYRRSRPQWIDLGTLKHYGITSECREEYFHTAYRPEELVELAHQAGLTVMESGTLEKEIKYAAKIPAAILLAVRLLNRLFRSQKLERANEILFDKLTLWIYYFCHVTRLEALLLSFVSEGVRSYILMQKNSEPGT
jgi:2-polyprenyl-3-methyl-5-hydroxy-6-metoxy-1,4-benzoquinol methylase